MDERGADYFVCRVMTSRQKSLEPLDVPIYIGGDEVGGLCLLREVRVQVAALTIYQREAFLRDSENVESQDGWYVFRSDYVVIGAEWRTEYSAAMGTSAFWGQYVHAESPGFEVAAAGTNNERIDVDQRQVRLTPRHQESLSKYAAYGRPTDRFLFLYHFMEIDFEREFVRRIKAVDMERAFGIGKILKDMGGNEELPRLIALVKDMPVAPLEEIAGNLRNHMQVAESVFYDFGKESNPILDINDFRQLFSECPTVSYASFLDHKKNSASISINLTKTNESYLVAMRKLGAYWTYRVRCCIAHNKMGEYHMMTSMDMEFMEGFAIPMLRSMISFRMSVASLD